jgi:hypothetical protein
MGLVAHSNGRHGYSLRTYDRGREISRTLTGAFSHTSEVPTRPVSALPSPSRCARASRERTCPQQQAPAGKLLDNTVVEDIRDRLARGSITVLTFVGNDERA